MKKIFVCLVLALFITSTTISTILTIAKKNNTSSFAEMMDQSQTWEDECRVVEEQEWQQFIPTLDNLNRVELKLGQWFSSSPDIRVSIEKILGRSLTSKTLPATSIPPGSCGWVNFDVKDIPLTPGETYYIKVTAPLGSEYGWGWASNNLYPIGESSDPPGDWCFKTYGEYNPAIPGLSFSIVEFLIKDEYKISDYGHLSVDIEELTSHFDLERGYLNVYTDDGWVIPNMYLNLNEYEEELSTYFRLSTMDETFQEFSAYVDFTDGPQRSFGDGDRADYNLSLIKYNADGLGLERRSVLAYPPEIWEYFPVVTTWDFTKPLQQGENIDAAWNQCAPMGVANSLQYLENNYASITIPHIHKDGQNGDSSLVGQLDAAMARTVSSRISGDGCNCPQILEGKFEYLKDNGLENKLVHKHQGYGFFGMPAGDYTAHGITSKDESAPGGIVTFEWIYDQLKKCEDVEVGIDWYGPGGHMVRIYGCGRTNGEPYLKFCHDRTQAQTFKPDGVTCYEDYGVGLECGIVYVKDLDGDGMMNWGAWGDNIVFAMSESPAPTIIIPDIWSTVLRINVLLLNEGEEEEVVDWEIKVDCKFMLMGESTEGTLELPPGKEETIRSDFIIGFGPATITVEVNDIVETRECRILGPFILGLS